MGHGASIPSVEPTRWMGGEPDEDFKEYLESQREALELMLNDKLAMETMVEHYYPPSFPIEPIVTQRTVEVCRSSWARVKAIERDGRSGMVYFFDIFYARLFERSSVFKDFFKGDMKKKGKILIRIMEFFCSLNLGDPRPFQATMTRLGGMHRKMGIRPWMFSVFVETMVNTITYVLGKEATYEVSTAWTNIAAYVMRHMLPAAIAGAIKTGEADFAYYDATAHLYAIARAAAERRCAANAAGVKTGSLSTPTAPEAALQQQRHTSSESGLAHTITVSPSKRLDKIQLLNIQPSTAQSKTAQLAVPPPEQPLLNKQGSGPSARVLTQIGDESATMVELFTAPLASTGKATTATAAAPRESKSITLAVEVESTTKVEPLTDTFRISDLGSSSRLP